MSVARAFCNDLRKQGHKIGFCPFNAPNEIMMEEPVRGTFLSSIDEAEHYCAWIEKAFDYPFVMFDMSVHRPVVLVCPYKSTEECSNSIVLLKESGSCNFVKVFDTVSNEEISQDLCQGLNTTPRPNGNRREGSSLFSQG